MRVLTNPYYRHNEDEHARGSAWLSIMQPANVKSLSKTLLKLQQICMGLCRFLSQWKIVHLTKKKTVYHRIIALLQFCLKKGETWRCLARLMRCFTCLANPCWHWHAGHQRTLISTYLFAEDWQEFNNRQYLFVMDAERQLDLSRAEAMKDCEARDGGLVSIETEDEMAFLKRRIKIEEAKIGQETLNDQWWTSGAAPFGEWVWDDDDMETSECMRPFQFKCIYSCMWNVRWLICKH